MSTPSLRFKLFTDKWHTKKIKDIATVNQGLQIPISNRFYENSENRYFYITNEFLKPNSRVNYFIENPPKSVLCNDEDILMTRTGNTGQVVTNVSGAFHNNFFKINYDKTIISKNFLLNFLKLKRTQHTIMTFAGQSTIPDLNHSDFYKLKISFPSLSEQEKIGLFFNTLERKILLQQEKINLLKEQKKGFMQKIFSRELRFKDEGGNNFPEWEKRKLSDLIKVNSGRDYKHLQQGNIPVYGTGGYMLSVNQSLSEADSIGIGRKGTIDVPQMLKAPFWTVDTLFYCTPIEPNNLQFIYALFEMIRWKSFDESTGVPSLSKKTIENIMIYVPNVKEQNKIGDFFEKINTKIDYHVQKLQELNRQKQAFMQQMFI